MSDTCTITWWECIGTDGWRGGVGRTPELAQLDARAALLSLWDDDPQMAATQLTSLSTVRVRLSGVPEERAVAVVGSLLDWGPTEAVRDRVVIRRTT